ncbi:hypothetical protein [Pseudarthrobacter enclensis]|uniref:Uncharacterized protein n=1 Tax=Pseudarthrobacter enclensis TaxID=993070 RepID=A0ABT9RWJ7_9MICC|nr:hypothetical protein [Pseudarthrobacter enclensis]MDP9888674.1 hypothetical protein [Pseudarthrobacter enclensis]
MPDGLAPFQQGDAAVVFEDNGYHFVPGDGGVGADFPAGRGCNGHGFFSWWWSGSWSSVKTAMDEVMRSFPNPPGFL